MLTAFFTPTLWRSPERLRVNTRVNMRQVASALLLTTSAAWAVAAYAGSTLLGRAVLPASTFAPGPSAGQFVSGNTNGVVLPLDARQPVQGFSAVLRGPKRGAYYVMSDNGFGAKANSADALLRVYAVEPDFHSGAVHPVDFVRGKRLPGFTPESFITLHDPDRKLGFAVVADAATYPGSTLNVAPEVRQRRLLTGGDLDIESIRLVKNEFWFGDEFGPFLVRTDRQGKVLQAAVSLPNTRQLGANPLVQSPDNPLLASSSAANLPRSRGFEGMALSAHHQFGQFLYTLLEGALTTDSQPRRLIVNEFDLKKRAYTERSWAYKTDDPSHAIGDFTAVNRHVLLVIERDGGQGPTAKFKKIFKVDLRRSDADGFLHKEEVVDLLAIADPEHRGGNGTVNGVFSFPFVTIENVLPLGQRKLLVINDNNYPFSTGRTAGVPDDNEFILIGLDKPLAGDEREDGDND
jgi:hypothetical protein